SGRFAPLNDTAVARADDIRREPARRQVCGATGNLLDGRVVGPAALHDVVAARVERTSPGYPQQARRQTRYGSEHCPASPALRERPGQAFGVGMVRLVVQRALV